MADLKKLISKIPQKCGVYQFLDSSREVLYVGKAISLRSRVGSYFTSNHNDRPWIRQMLPIIADIKTIQTENEVEALILETNLIKKYRPKYNSMLKDDKSYAWVYIDTQNPFPRIRKLHDLGKSRKKGKYLGPYPDGRPINRMMKYLRNIYPYASCKLKFYPDRPPEKVKNKRVCLYYHLGQCSGPCDNLISVKKYREDIFNIVKTLEGRKKSHIKELEKKMTTYAKNQNFEKAAVLRDKISDLRYLSQRIDLGFGDTEKEFEQIRKERYIAGLKEAINKLELNIPEHKVKNMRTECYDVSNIGGLIAYTSMTVTIGGQTDNSKYRIFKIKEEEKTDDTKMMKEAISRRLKHLEDEELDTKESLNQKPNLILLDGGKAQLSAIKPLIPENIGLMGISKGKHLKRAGQQQKDEFWTVNKEGKFKKINLQNPFIFQMLRDEAHRFAIKHHRKGRKFLQKKSVLDEIEGIGPKRKKELMKKFKTVSGIKKASVKQLNEVVKNKKVANAIFEKFNGR